jgi:hypothetical protein
MEFQFFVAIHALEIRGIAKTDKVTSLLIRQPPGTADRAYDLVYSSL